MMYVNGEQVLPDRIEQILEKKKKRRKKRYSIDIEQQAVLIAAFCRAVSNCQGMVLGSTKQVE